MAEIMTLIAGRTAKQGVSLNAGKLTSDYREITSSVEMNRDDMARLGLADGDRVRLSTGEGAIVVRCTGRKPEDLPASLLFLAYGPPSGQLMGGDTALTGMPISKNLEVEVEPLDDAG
jgi:formylmethanofuran dehydrogenase subunit D